MIKVFKTLALEKLADSIFPNLNSKIELLILIFAKEYAN